MPHQPSTSRSHRMSHIIDKVGPYDITIPQSCCVYGFALGKGTEKKVFNWIFTNLPLFSSHRQCFIAASKKFSVAIRTIYYWWNHFQFYEEMPSETREFYDELRKKAGYFRYSDTIYDNPDLLQMLQDILNEHPEYYLDQFVHAFYRKSHILVSPSTIYRCLHNRLDYRLLAVQEIALQQNKADRELFKDALLQILEHPEMLVLVDETHKDKNASHRKRAWGQKVVILN